MLSGILLKLRLYCVLLLLEVIHVFYTRYFSNMFIIYVLKIRRLQLYLCTSNVEIHH